MKRVLIVGAGLSGCVVARELAEAGVASLVVDKEAHVGGMCYSRRDDETGVDVHVFGPHIFNTNSEKVWNYVSRFDRFYPWVNRVKASNRKGIYSFPINLHTINQLFSRRFTPSEARAYIDTLRDKTITNPRNAEEKLLSMVGSEIYETFFKGYTIKQWGVTPAEMPADILKRIPVRFNYDDNYYNSRYQGLPLSGYTQWLANMLNHPLISVKTLCAYEPEMRKEFIYTFYAGPLDAYFAYAAGELSYRHVRFEITRGEFEQQGCACVNHSDLSVPYTRSHEHNYFSPWETHEKSVLIREFSSESPSRTAGFYPKRTARDMEVFARYLPLVEQEQGVSFIGRLGCYRYLDMQQCVLMSLDYAERWLKWYCGDSDLLPKMPCEY